MLQIRTQLCAAAHAGSSGTGAVEYRRLYQQYDQLPEFDAQCQQPEAAAPTAPMEREVEKVQVDRDGSPQQRAADEQEVAVASSATGGPHARRSTEPRPRPRCDGLTAMLER